MTVCSLLFTNMYCTYCLKCTCEAEYFFKAFHIQSKATKEIINACRPIQYGMKRFPLCFCFDFGGKKKEKKNKPENEEGGTKMRGEKGKRQKNKNRK